MLIDAHLLTLVSSDFHRSLILLQLHLFFCLLINQFISIMINPEESLCSICLLANKKPSTLSSCKHDFCHSCIIRHLQSLVEQGCRRLENFRCPQIKCQTQISEDDLEKWMHFDYFSKLTNKIMYESSILCPECRTRIDIVGNPETWRCFNCYSGICKFCKATQHDGKCQTKTVYFNEVRTTIEDQEIGYCPQCITPFLKDENCDHVTCENPECGFQFCFSCSASYSPIYYHGGMYHRTDCRNYETYEGFQISYYCQCTECQKMGIGCPLPLQTKEQFIKELIARAEARNQQMTSA